MPLSLFRPRCSRFTHHISKERRSRGGMNAILHTFHPTPSRGIDFRGECTAATFCGLDGRGCGADSPAPSHGASTCSPDKIKRLILRAAHVYMYACVQIDEQAFSKHSANHGPAANLASDYGRRGVVSEDVQALIRLHAWDHLLTLYAPISTQSSVLRRLPRV
ncbi:hypothetical protein NM688_g6547 [Phlebia brevispora]|uniref:Uncharacterized protein n=1 Tax=Phlebia brevispora TaxID=194682 RepID=A0ACC1SEU6_9APHY|nr:hypothetical protein NM688_g6547 [Phlebia brevispora]